MAKRNEAAKLVAPLQQLADTVTVHVLAQALYESVLETPRVWADADEASRAGHLAIARRMLVRLIGVQLTPPQLRSDEDQEG